jgi:serine/threonine protein phosphatase PrpC
MNLLSRGLTDKGRVRRSNEDDYCVEEAGGVFAVADGVGGNRCGEVASATFCGVVKARKWVVGNALAAARDRGESIVRQECMSALLSIFNEASYLIFTKAQEEDRFSGMCTTGIVLAMLDGAPGGAAAVLGHVGDSRAYLLRTDRVCRLTHDHTVAQQLFDEGTLTPEEFRNHPHRNVLTRAIGSFPTVKVDALWVDVLPGDLFLLCSDGLSMYLEDRELLSYSRLYAGEDLASRLIETANSRGGRDNVTCVTVQVRGATAQLPSFETTQRVAILSDILLFRTLTNQEILVLLKAVYEEMRPAGEIVVREGDPANDLFIVADGELEVRAGDRVLTRVRKGEHFGDLALVDHGPRSATVRAVTDSRLFRIPADDFYRLTRSDPSLAMKLLWGLMEYAAARIRDLSGRAT